jgi:pimeloyl-ACP methyl ester carboxylesterase
MDYLHTPKLLTEHIIEYRDCPLHYWLAGDTDKPLIVMTHGATMDHRMFRPIP